MSTIVAMPLRVKPPPAEIGEIISPGCAALTVTTPANGARTIVLSSCTCATATPSRATSIADSLLASRARQVSTSVRAVSSADWLTSLRAAMSCCRASSRSAFASCVRDSATCARACSSCAR